MLADETVVTAHVSGDFPAVPSICPIGFKLADGLIAELAIG